MSEIKCVECGNLFIGIEGKKYCSDKCGTKARVTKHRNKVVVFEDKVTVCNTKEEIGSKIYEIITRKINNGEYEKPNEMIYCGEYQDTQEFEPSWKRFVKEGAFANV